MAKMTWESNGKKVELIAEYSEKLVEKTYDLDGDICTTGEKEVIRNTKLILYINGKKAESSYNDTWRFVDKEINGTKAKKLTCFAHACFPLEKAIEVEAFLAQVIADGKIDEVTEFENQKRIEKAEKEIEELSETVKKAESQKDIPTREEKIRRLEEFNNINNDGGEGYLPTIIDIIEYNYALERIAELKEVLK